jgi:phosphatidylglycerophosphate synthase
MELTRRGGLQNIAAGFMIIAIAVAILVAWMIDSWWMFFPIILLEVGAFYTALGLVMRAGADPNRRGPTSSSYYVFWGPTLVVIAFMWILAAETDVSGVLLFAIFLLWIGVMAVLLSVFKPKRQAQA